MAEDQPDSGQAPESTSPAEPGQVPVAPANPAPPAPAAPPQTGDEWDPERAKATISKLREEEKRAKLLAKEKSDLEARLKQMEDAQLSEDQKREKAHQDALARAAELEQREAALAQQLKAERLQNAVERAAGRDEKDKNGAVKRPAFHAPDEAYALLNKDAIEYDEQGNPTNIDVLLVDLATKRPHLVKAEPKASAGSPANPGRGAATEPSLTHAQRRDMVYGTGFDMFDPAQAKRAGGGVVYAGDKES